MVLFFFNFLFKTPIGMDLFILYSFKVLVTKRAIYGKGAIYHKGLYYRINLYIRYYF